MTEKNLFDVLIVGGGPAGITAAIYSARASLKVIIIEKDYFGGKLNKTLSIENYPGYLENNGPELSEKMMSQIEENNVTHVDEEVIKIEKNNQLWKVDTKKNSYQAKAILIATGTKEKTLGIKNEIEYYGNGVSYCAICDGNLYRNKDVIVVGGGNAAAEESIYLSKLVKTVKLVHRRNEFRADGVFMKKIKNISNIEIHTPFQPSEVVVTDGKVVGLEVSHSETHNNKMLSGECVFFYIGSNPQSSFLNNLNIEKNKDGYIVVDKNMCTNLKGVFAAGDVIEKDLRQVVTALNDGAIAAISMKNYIENDVE